MGLKFGRFFLLANILFLSSLSFSDTIRVSASTSTPFPSSVSYTAFNALSPLSFVNGSMSSANILAIFNSTLPASSDNNLSYDITVNSCYISADNSGFSPTFAGGTIDLLCSYDAVYVDSGEGENFSAETFTRITISSHTIDSSYACTLPQVQENGICVVPSETCESMSSQFPNDSYDNLFNYQSDGSNCVTFENGLTCSMEPVFELLSPQIPDVGSYVDGYVTSEACNTPSNDDDSPVSEDNLISFCVEGVTQNELCLTSDNEISYFDGNLDEHSPEEGQICWEVGTGVICDDPIIFEQNCGYVNGQVGCWDAFGDYIDTDSPDHPDNGGNADGNVNNDMLDPYNDSDTLTDLESNSRDLGPVIDAIDSQTEALLEQAVLDAEAEQLRHDEFIEYLDEESDISFDEDASPGYDGEQTGIDVGQEIIDSINNTKLASIASTLKSAFNRNVSNSCPSLDVDLTNVSMGNHSYSGHCDILTSYNSLFKTIFSIVWIFVGFRIVGSS